MDKKYEEKYNATTQKQTVNGKTFTIINRHPILDPEEKERRTQEFLKCVDKIMKKYNIN